MIADKIIEGYRLKSTDDLSFLLTTPLEELQTGARLIHQKFFDKRVDLCTIINGKSGRCGEDCKYCAQSARHATGIDEYDFLNTFDDRITTIKLAQAAGLEVCSGGIIGMGETWQDRIDLAFELAALKVNSIPINVLTPIKGTPLENMPRLGAEEILRTIAIFRYINPTASVRLAAGRKFLPDRGASAFLYGADAAITGNMLTTSNININSDLIILSELGLTNKGRADYE